MTDAPARITLVADDTRYRNELQTLLRDAGYTLDVHKDLQTFRNASLTSVPPSAVLLGMATAEGEEAAARFITELKAQRCPDLPVIFLSARSSMTARLAALRAGATHTLTRPVSSEHLLEVLDDMLTQNHPAQPFRVMVVDDTPATLLVAAEILRQAGMQVLEAGDPLMVPQLLENFAADVLVLDMYMPQCSGPELLSILREDDQNTGIPVIFLSAETNLTRQFKALDQGGDFFLTKPIVAEHLISAVARYAKRARHARRQLLARAGRMANRAFIGEPDESARTLMVQHKALDRHAIVSIADASGTITYVNDMFCKVSGFAREELLGRNHRVIKSGDHPPEFYHQMWATISHGKTWQGEVCNRRKGGGRYWVASTILPVLDDDGLPVEYVSIRTEITQLKQAEEALAVARDFAEEANRAKSEFLASISHELRTPLNAILGFSQLLNSDETLTADQVENVHEIEQAGTHLLSLVNDLIDMARIEAGKLALSMEPVELSSVINDSLSMVAPIASTRGIALLNELGECAKLKVRADYVRLRQVTINFLSNAIKYNRPQGTVVISCETMRGEDGEPSTVRISITDTGPGIPREKQARLFSAFDRLGAERGEVEGSGIGLVITQKIAEAMGGAVGFVSTEGKGSTFWVEMPLTTASRELVQAQESAPPLKPQLSSGISEDGVRRRVLYIEDNPANVRLMQQFFSRRNDLELRDTHTAEIGISLARALPPSLILMDINLPGMNGIEALRVLRADPRTAGIPVIAVSANAMQVDISNALLAGFTDYLTKPIKIPSLFKAVDAALEVGRTPVSSAD